MARAIEEGRFVRSEETQLIVDLLEALIPGESMTYSRLSRLTGLDIAGAGHPRLLSAINILRREGRALFKCMPTVGLRRLRNDEIPLHSAERHRKRFENDTRRYSHALGCVDVDALPDDKKGEYRYSRAMLGIRQAIVEQTKTSRGSRYGSAMQPHLEVNESDLVQRMKELSGASLDPGRNRRRMMQGV